MLAALGTPKSAATAESSARPRGRRPAGEDTRGRIVLAARAEFGSRGYDGTTMRGVARAADVDARLVHHYFDSKEDLFVSALGFPARPQDILAVVLAGPIEEIGERLARAVFAIWDSAEGRDRIVALLSGALSSEAVARMLREFLAREILGRVAVALKLEHGELRAALAASHLVGIAIARIVLKVEPLASVDLDRLVRIVGPALRRYLTDPELPV
ncbi:MAG TPA: TetR family transcriptional regulator [Kineosporiaceae bacterium]|nr:TetR family transcriptional regulator [Kineosporiaceae bacterium]